MKILYLSIIIILVSCLVILNNDVFADDSIKQVIIDGHITPNGCSEVNGTVTDLSRNEKLNNIRVLNINSSELTASFEINGKIFTKTMRSLTDEGDGNVELVRNYHN